jgi:predicted NAD/FAD-binding protein
MILPHLRIWVLAKHHRATFYEDGVYRMGAPTNWSRAMVPYVEKMQRLLDDGTQPVFDETIYPGLTKITSYIQALRRLHLDVI